VAVPSFVKGNPEVQSSLGSALRNSPAGRDDLDAFYAEEESEGEGETEGSEESESEDAPEVNLTRKAAVGVYDLFSISN